MSDKGCNVEFPPDGPRQRTPVACKPCRQNKIRCGMRSPPCARCLRLNFHCTVEPCYRRVNQRDRVRHLEAEVQELRHMLQNNEERAANVQSANHALGPDAFQPNRGLGESWEAPIAGTLEPGSQANRDRRVGTEMVGEEEAIDLQERPHRVSDFTLGPVSVSKTQGEQLFNRFFRKFHPILPFLDPSKSCSEYYSLSHLLFWSIIAVAARHYQPDPSLLTKVTPALTELLWKAISSNPISLAQTQALILISCWPLPNFRFWSDKSPVYANIALTYATHLGLHVRGHEREYSKEIFAATGYNVLERSKAWVACEILSQSHNMDQGLPPLMPLQEFELSNQVGDGILPNIPLELQHNFLIQNCSYRARKIILGRRESETIFFQEDGFYEKMQRIEESFQLLDWKLNKELSYLNSLRLSGAMLYYQCLYFLREERQREEQKKSGILRAYKTASSIIARTIGHSSAHDELTYAPVGILRIICTAALVIFRVQHSTYSLADAILSPTSQQVDSNGAKILYNSACFVIQSCSINHDDQDYPARMSGMLETLWRCGENDVELRNREPTSKVKSRMGASIVFDCLRIWREYKSGSNADSQKARSAIDCLGGPQRQQQPQPNLEILAIPLPRVTESDRVGELNLSMLNGAFSASGWGEVPDSECSFATGFVQDILDCSLYGFM